MERRISRRDFLKIATGFTAGAVLSACGGSSHGEAPASNSVAPAVEAQPIPTQQPAQAWEKKCTVQITVEQGDTVDGSISQKAAQACPEINSNDIHNSWYFQHGDRKMNTIQPGEVLQLSDYVNE